MRRTQNRWSITTIVVTCGVFAGLVELSSQQAWGGGKVNPVVDQFQKSYEILNHNEVATSGAARGQTLDYHKCLTCHYAGAREGDMSGLIGPTLEDLAKRRTNEVLT